MSRRLVPTLFDFLDSIGIRITECGLTVPSQWEPLIPVLVPFREELIEEGVRRAEVRRHVKPMSGVVRVEDLKKSVRLMWELQAHMNAHAVIEETNKESPCTDAKWMRGAKHGVLCGFMLAVELMAERYGIDLDTVPEQN